MASLEAIRGADRAWKLTLIGGDGVALTSFAGTETLASSCWTGDDQEASFSPTATWIDASEGTIRLSVAGSQTTDLSPGTYNLQLSITSGGVTVKQNLPGLRILPSPGTAEPPATYCTLDDLRRVAAWVDQLQDLDTDQTGFAEQRAIAWQWLVLQVMARFRRIQSGQARLGSSWAALDAEFDSSSTTTLGYDSGPGSGPSSVPDATIRTAETTLLGYLDDGLLMTADDSPDRGLSRRIMAHYAMAEICQPQIGNAPGSETSYQLLATQFRNRAIGMLGGWRARIDTASDGTVGLELR